MKTAKEFHEFFSLIPENRWGKRDYINLASGCFCAMGHCGVTDYGWTPNGRSANRLFEIYLYISAVDVNDSGPTGNPKRDILDALQVIAELGG